MELELKNDQIAIKVRSQGAELRSLRELSDGTEYLWNGDPSWWKYSSPVLFPIVGKLRDGRYAVDGKTYELPQHGLARTREFELLRQDEGAVWFELKYNEETLAIYPFKFSLQIGYELSGRSVKVCWKVGNLDESKPLYFSIGAHPALRCPIVPGEQFSDCYLDFGKPQSSGCYEITPEVLFLHGKRPDLKGVTMPFSYELFKNGVHVFDDLSSDSFTIRSQKSGKSITLTAPGFPFLGIWTPEKGGAPFICIEPWYGHADYADFSGEFKDREGVIKIEPAEVFEASYTLSLG